MLDREKPGLNASSDSDSEFYSLIHDAVATYGEPASDSDLAQRILSQDVAENTWTSTRRWLPWAAALSIAAGLVILFVLLAPKPAHTPAGTSAQTHLPAQPPSRAGSTTVTRSFETNRASGAGLSRLRTRHLAVAANPQQLPKLDTFPAPQMLTPEEQVLAAYASDAPEVEQRALIEAHNRLEAPLTIAAIEIQPLEPPVPGGN
jgi:hypothetical protein